MDRADLDYLINGIVNGLSGTGSFSGGRGGAFTSTGGYISSNRNTMSQDDLDARFEKYRDRLENVGKQQSEYKLSETEKYLKLQQEIEETEERISELYDEINDNLDRRNELLEKQADGTITDDELAELEEYNEKLDEANAKMDEHVRLKQKAGNTSLGGSMMKDLSGIMSGFKQIKGALDDLTSPYRKLDAAASKYAKTIGMTKAGMESLKKTSLDHVAGKLASEYNISTDELIEAQSNYLKASGRNIRVDNADQEAMAAMKAVGGNGNELAALYDNFGVSMEATADHVGKMFSDASKQGLSFEKYSDNVAKNIKIAQNYTFKNGLKGLESMAKKATAMKMDMQQVAQLADKVSTVEGAIDVSAQLQVLGGPFAQLADPLGMLNEGLNDMEGLQDRLIKMVGGLGSFDKETGEVKVSAFNKQRLKAATSAMGVDYSAIMESVNAQARRGEIEKQISASQIASGFDDDMKELIKNSGTIKDGKAGVSIRGQFKALDDLTAADKEAIQKESQTESEDIKDIAADLRSIDEKISGFEKAKEARQAQMYDTVSEFYGKAMKWLSKLGPLLTIVSIIQGIVAAQQIGNALGNIGRGIKGLFKGGKGLLGKIGNFFKGRAGGAGNSILGRMGGSVKNIFNGTKGMTGGLTQGAGNLISGAKNMMGTASKVTTQAAKTVTKATGGIVKGGVQRTATRAIAKVGGKAAAKSAVKIGAGLAKGVAVGGPLGIVGAIGDVATNALVASGKMKKGGVGHHVGKGLSGAASGAAMGAMIGSVIPVVGTAIGAVVGGIGGAIKGLFSAGKAKQERILEEKVQKLGVTVNGKYGKGQLKDINHALEQGYISNRMRKKLEKKGDHELLAAIDKKAEEKRAKGEEIKKRSFWDRDIGKLIKYGNPLGGFFMARNIFKKAKDSKFGKKVASTFAKKPGLKGAAIGMVLGGPIGAAIGAGIGAVTKTKVGKAIGGFLGRKPGLKGGLKGAAIGMALGGPIGAVMGASIGGIVGAVKKHNKKFNAKSKKSVSEIFKNYTTNVKPVLEKGMNNKYGEVNKKNNEIHVKTDPHDVKINGTLNIKGQDGKTIDIVSELKNNPQMLRNVTNMISNEMGVLEKGVNVAQRA